MLATLFSGPDPADPATDPDSATDPAEARHARDPDLDAIDRYRCLMAWQAKFMKHLSVATIAEVFSVAPRTIYRWIEIADSYPETVAYRREPASNRRARPRP